MAVIRPSVISNAAARDSFIRGVKLLKQEFPPRSSLSTYDLFVVWHHRAMMMLTPPGNASGRNRAHLGPVFLPWHRFMLIVLEQQLQRVLEDSNFGLPYWNWGADGDLPPAEQRRAPLWADDCMGGTGAPLSTGPFAFDPGDSKTWVVRVAGTSSGTLQTVSRGLARALGSAPGLPTSAEVRAVLEMTPYDVGGWDGSSRSFRNYLEGWQPGPGPRLHNLVHVWVSGDMGRSTSPNDPIFYLNHANVDRIWAAWQRKHDEPYAPDAGAPDELRGHRLADSLASMFPNAPAIRDMVEVSDILWL